MKYLILSLAMGLLPYQFASADTLGSAPPKDFMALDVCLQFSASPCSLSEFVDLAFSSDAKRNWEKANSTQWILTLNSLDKVSKKNSKLVVEFSKRENGDKNSAAITRMISNGGDAFLARDGKVYAAADEEISQQMLPSVVVPLIEMVNEKTGRAAVARAKGKENAAKRDAKERAAQLQAVAGDYYQNSEHVEISKISDDTVKAKISVQCSPLPNEPFKTYDDQTLTLKYDSESGQYISNLKVDKCDLGVKFGSGQMDSRQGIEFLKTNPRAKGCCISGRFLKRTAEEEAKAAKVESQNRESQNANQTLQNETIAALSGQYESKQSKVGGTFTIQAQPDNKVKVSYERMGCKFEEKNVAMEYLKFNKTSVGTLTEGSCSLKLKFMHVGTTHQDVLSIDENGSCKPLCSYSDGSTSLMGNFVKK